MAISHDRRRRGDRAARRNRAAPRAAAARQISLERQDHGARRQQSHSHRPSRRGSGDSRDALGHDGGQPAARNLRELEGQAVRRKQERTEWHSVALFGRLGEIAAEYLRKGSQVYIEGRLRTRKWQDKEGRDRYTTEIIASDMQMLGGRGGGGGGGGGGGYADSAGTRPRERRGKRRHRRALRKTSTTISRSKRLNWAGCARIQRACRTV